MLNIQQLITFVTVVTEGSMTEAANKLHVTQPAISQQIRSLEEYLGLELLMRNSRTIQLTAHGELLFEQAKKILNIVSQAEMSVKTLGSHLQGQLKIGTLNALGIQLVSPAVSRFLRFHPKVSFRVDFDHEELLIDKFRQKQLDVVILSEESLSALGSEIQKKLLLKEKLCLVTSGRDTPMQKSISFRELHQKPFCLLTDEYRAFNERFYRKQMEEQVPLNVVFSTSNVGTLKRVIENGLGWGFLPYTAVQKQLHSGRLQMIEMSDFQFECSFYYVVHKKISEDSSALAQAFLMALENWEKS